MIPTVEGEKVPRNPEVERLGAATMETLTFLTNELSPRASGTQEEVAAAEYLRDELAALGYDASIQPFEVRSISPYGRLLTVDEPQPMDVRAFPMWMTAAGVVTGQVVDVGRALPEDIPSDGLEGKIALIERGEKTFDEKVMEVFKAGAIGAIVYNNEPGPFVGALAEESIPAVTVSQEDGGALKALVEDGPATATISLVYTEESRNVIADKPGTADDGRVVVLGGHYDTVPAVPGANDNGSGIATLLTIAREIADREYPFTVRFIAFGAEELGLRGSQHYVDQLSEEEIDATVAMLNFDALGSGPTTATLGHAEPTANGGNVCRGAGHRHQDTLHNGLGRQRSRSLQRGGNLAHLLPGRGLLPHSHAGRQAGVRRDRASRFRGLPGDGAAGHAGGGGWLAGLLLERL